jgi:hypothetical protein
MSETINITKGQTLLFYKGSNIVLRKKYDVNSSVTTSWESFVGTDEQVDAKIKELSLGLIKKPLVIKQPRVIVKMKRQGLLTRIYNYIKQLF